MSFVTGSLQNTSNSPGRYASTRGRMGGVGSSLAYPNPFFDIAGSYLPTTYKSLFRWSRFFFMTTSILPAIVFKLAEYPLTDVIFEHEDPGVRDMWTDFMHESLRLRAHQLDSGLDYYVYGNNLTSIHFPFKKFLTCRKCRRVFEAELHKNLWTSSSFEFRLKCPGCQHVGPADVRDVPIRNPSGIRLLRYSPENVSLKYNEANGETRHYYDVPGSIKTDMLAGKKETLATTPQAFFDALKERKALTFNQQNLFHMKRGTLAEQDRGWGLPLLLPVLKDVFYLQLMKKAQEVIMTEHILPLRILFPQAGSGSSDPYSTVDLGQWKEHMSAEIARWRYDPNYIPIVPLPIGNQTLGGDGKALLVTPEIQEITRQIIAGMGVPQEFVYGGMSYAGTNVSMRMLENQFLVYIMQMRAQVRWLVQQVASFMGWPMPAVRFKPFKMADDLQRKQYLFQLNGAGKVSDTTLLLDADLDQKTEDDLRDKELDRRLASTKREQLAMAEMQGEQQIVMAKAQARAQQVQQEALQQPIAPGEPGGPEPTNGGGGAAGGQGAESAAQTPEVLQAMQSPIGQSQKGGPPQAGVSIEQMAMQLAQQLIQMAPEEQQAAMSNLQAQSPELAQMVQQFAQQLQAQDPASQAPGVDMRPLPEQLPARRDAQLV